MSESERWVSLDQAASFASGGTPSKANPDYWNGHIPWVSAKDMKSSRIFYAEDHITEIGAANGSRLAPAGATLVLVRGMTLLNDVPICLATRDVAFNQDVKALVAKAGVVDRYLNYAIHAAKPTLLSAVDLAGHGTGKLPTDIFKSIRIRLPDEDEQRAIAHILGTLDDKIELNRRMNETLEAIARAIFKSWFVDFDPVRAKASELIKEGVLAIGDGYRAKNDELGIEGTPFIRAAELNNGFDTVNAERLRTDRLPAAKGKHAMVGDVAFTSKGTVGRFARVSEHTEPFIYSPQICFWRSLRPEVIHPAVLYCWMRSGEFVSQIDGVAGQTDMAPYVSLRDQKAMEVPRFHESQVQVGEQIAPLLRLISEQQAECHNLATLRDTLLPKLIAGELSPSRTDS